MRYRPLGRTGWHVSEIGFGAWAIGADWGLVSETDALAALDAALDSGVNFIDTADVYGDGRSERLISRILKQRSERVYVATKIGRRLVPHQARSYTGENLALCVERCLSNLNVEALDLVQLHCPPSPVYYMPEVFSALDDLVRAGKVRHYGVSVEKVEEGIKALEYPGVQSVQIIFNIFRQRPAELFFGLAKQCQVGILARVPLASGLLTGKMDLLRTFPHDDHRRYNRHGERFDVGETFAGVDFASGVNAAQEFASLLPAGASMAQYALRWILMFDAVTCAIPGSKNLGQTIENAKAADLPALKDDLNNGIRQLYNRRIRPQVHQRW